MPLVRRSPARAAEHVLDEDHRAVDDDAEVDRAHRQQVGRHAAHVQVDERRGERERDDAAPTISDARSDEQEDEQHDA